MKKHTIFLLLACCLFLSKSITAQDSPTPILFIYDASGSMWGDMNGKTKKEIASSVLSSSINSLAADQQLALMAYGHRKEGDCNDIEWLAEMTNTSKTKIIQAVGSLNPKGRTPLARSASMAMDKLRIDKQKATIILITDGIESCDGDICKVIEAATLEGIEFKLHIVGFGLKENETTELRCAAKAGNGQYFHATDAEGLGEMLTQATQKTIDKPTPNFSVNALKNGEPVDAWVKARRISEMRVFDAARTYRDTAFIFLPPGSYTVEIKPLEGSDVKGTSIEVDISDDKPLHHTIYFDAASIVVSTTNNKEGHDSVVKVFDHVTKKVVASSRTYGRSKSMEVNPGNYDVTFQALTMKGNSTTFTIENVHVKGGETKELTHNFETGIASIGVQTASGELIDASVSFVEKSSGNPTASGRTYTSSNSNPKEFILNPGVYTVKISTLGKHKGKNESVLIEVKMGETTEKIIKF